MDKKLNNEEIEKGVFVINQHYEIVYMDETAKQTFPGCEQHAFCYQMLQESKTPCFDCPLKKTGHCYTIKSWKSGWSMSRFRWNGRRKGCVP